MNRSTLLASVAITPFLLAPTLAQQVISLDEIVVSGSLSPVSKGRTGATVEILEDEDMATTDASAIERLTRLPGVNATANGGLGAGSTVQIRGLPARYVIVRLNGIDMNDPSGTQSSFNFGTLTSAGIDRIEVLKGSQSALYGSEAIGGVIDITTFRPTVEGFSGRVGTELGSFGTASGVLSLGYLDDRAEVTLTYGRVATKGFSSNAGNTEADGFHQTTLTFTGRYALTDSFTMGAAVNYRDGVSDIDRSATNPEGNIFAQERAARVFGELVTGAVTHTFAYSNFDIERLDPTGFVKRFDGKRDRLSYLGSASLGSAYTLNFGVDRTTESFSSDSDAATEKTVSTQAELLFQPMASLDLSAALRYDDNSTFGGTMTGRFAGVWRPREDLAFRAVVGTGFRAPSLFERFSAYGDPALKPEQSRSFELGVEKGFGARAQVKATLFYTEIDDLIDFDGGAVACGSGFGCYNQVPGTTKSRGIELSGNYALSDATEVYGSYTFTDAKTDGVRLARTPRHDLVLGAQSDFSERLSGSLEVSYIADVVPSIFAPANNLVGDYVLVGAGLTYDVTDTAQAYLRIENMFDEKYETAGGFNTPRRSVFAGLRADF